MKARIAALLKLWQTYIAFVASILALFAAATKSLDSLSPSFITAQYAPLLRWILAIFFFLAACVAWISVFSRRSVLRRPEEFLLTADNPKNLLGREAEVARVIDELQSHRQVFVVGESGAGKSALVLGGIIPLLLPMEDHRQVQGLCPVVVDLSSITERESIIARLNQGLQRLGPDALEKIGLPPINAENRGDIVALLNGVKPLGSVQLLVILDQYDDYVAEHESTIYHDNITIKPSALRRAQSDWDVIARLLEHQLIRVLIIARSDSAVALEAVRFVEDSSTYVLRKPEMNLIRPLFDRLETTDEGDRPIVSEPEYGWVQLKGRILRDLSDGVGQVLPIRLAVVLDGLRHLQYLTPGEYEKHGGAKGLERLHINRLLSGFSSLNHRLNSSALLRGLLLLTSEDGLKTRPAPIDAFKEAVLAGIVGPVDSHLLEGTVHQLVGENLVRRVGNNGSFVMLHHDYLAVSVREAFRYENRWFDLLREKAADFDRAGGVMARWSALLPMRIQCELLWASLRGRVRVGAHWRYVVWSMARFGQPLLLIACVWFLVGTYRQAMQFKTVEAVLAAVGHSPNPDADEFAAWKRMATLNSAAREYAIELALSEVSSLPRLIPRSKALARAAVGLDSSGVISNRIVDEIILPALRRRDATFDQLSFATGVTAAMHPHPQRVVEVTTVLFDRLQAETDVQKQSRLVWLLSQLSGKLDEAGGKKMIGRWSSFLGASTQSALSNMGEIASTIPSSADAQDARSMADAIFQRTSLESDRTSAVSLHRGLEPIIEKLDPSDRRRYAKIVSDRLGREASKSDSNWESMTSLMQTLCSLTSALDPADRAWIGDEGVKVIMKAGADSKSYAYDVVGLYQLSKINGSLRDTDARSALSALSAASFREERPALLAAFATTAATVASQLPSDELIPIVKLLNARMENENDTSAILAYGAALVKCEKSVGYENVRGGLRRIVDLVMTDKSRSGVGLLCDFLSRHIESLGTDEIERLVEVLKRRIGEEPDSDPLSNLAALLKPTGGRCSSHEAQAVIDVIFGRLQSEPPGESLDRLGRMVAYLADRLDPVDVKSGVEALMVRVRSDKRPELIASVAVAIGGLGRKVDRPNLHEIFDCVIEILNNQDIRISQPTLGALRMAASDICAEADYDDVIRFVGLMFEKISIEHDWVQSVGEAEALKRVVWRLRPADAGVLAEKVIVLVRKNISLASRNELRGAWIILMRRIDSDDAIELCDVLNKWLDQQGYCDPSIIELWCGAASQIQAKDRRSLIQAHFNFLYLMPISDHVESAVLQNLDSLTGEHFNADVWRAVDWAVNVGSRKYHVRLK